MPDRMVSRPDPDVWSPDGQDRSDSVWTPTHYDKEIDMKTCCSLILVSALVLLAGGASAQNILVNGDFEMGDLTGWVVSGASPSSAVTVEGPDNGPALPGTHNAFLNNTAEALGLNLKQTTPVGSAGEGEVTYSFDLKLDQADVGGVFFVQIFAEQEGVGIVGGSGLMGPFWPWNAWQTFGGSFMAPAGTDFLTIQFVATTGAAVGSNCVAHLDNVILEAQGAVPAESLSWSTTKALFR